MRVLNGYLKIQELYYVSLNVFKYPSMGSMILDVSGISTHGFVLGPTMSDPEDLSSGLIVILQTIPVQLPLVEASTG